MDQNSVSESVQKALAPIAQDQGAAIETVTYNSKINPPVLAITVIREDSAESLKADQVADLARAFSRHLDESDPVPGQYTLEVSTPGAEGAIITEVQWRRSVGKTVRVTLGDGDKIEGQLTDVNADGVKVLVGDREQVIPFEKIKSARGVAMVPKEN